MHDYIAQKYREYLENGELLVNNDEILLFYPDYYKTKIELENYKPYTSEEISRFFQENYQNAFIYQTITTLNKLDEKKVYLAMRCSIDTNYRIISLLLDKLIASSILLCNLIDYLGHYQQPSLINNKIIKNLEMEELLAKYDIAIFPPKEGFKLQITADAITRIIGTLTRNLKDINSLSSISLDDYLNATVSYNNEELVEEYISADMADFIQKLNEIKNFPLSLYQKQGKSQREEVEMALKLTKTN